MNIQERSMNVFAHHTNLNKVERLKRGYPGLAAHRTLHDRGREACHSGFAGSLLPEVTLFFHRQSARREKCSHMLARRFRTLDAEPERLANSIGHGSCVAHEE